ELHQKRVSSLDDLKSGFEIGGAPRFHANHLALHPRRRRLRVGPVLRRSRVARIAEPGETPGLTAEDLREQLDALAPENLGRLHEPGDVAPRPRDVLDEARRYRIDRDLQKDDGNGAGDRLKRAGLGGSGAGQYIRTLLHQLPCQAWKSAGIAACPPLIDHEVLARAPPAVTKGGAEDVDGIGEIGVATTPGQVAQASGRLAPDRSRPGDRGCAQHAEERAAANGHGPRLLAPGRRRAAE